MVKLLGRCHLQADVSSAGTEWGTGGMATKLTAARLATAAGCHTAICQATQPEAIHRILRGARDVGTVFYCHPRLNRCLRCNLPDMHLDSTSERL